MKIIYISGGTGSGKTTALKTLCGEDNIFHGEYKAGTKLTGSTSIGIDDYRGKPIDEDSLKFLKYSGVTHLYIATENIPTFNK